MRLSWKDGLGTLLTAGAVAVALAVTNGWSWPFLGDARAGVLALAILGFASCPFATRMGPETRWTSPYLVLTAILGVAAIGLIAWGLFANSLAVLGYLTIVVVAMWFVTSIRHLVEADPAGRRQAIS